MHNSFSFVMPADANYHQLYPLLTAITGAIPTDGILPDRVSHLKIIADPGNAAATVTIAGLDHANSDGQALSGGDIFERGSTRNTICLKDYWLKGNALTVQVDTESM